MLLAAKDNYKLPDKIVSDCHITIEGEKLSKSKGNYISLSYLLDRYSADTIRYFFASNEAIKKDFNFSWNDFINSHNSELLGKWGNFINRTLVFINKSFDSKISNSSVDIDIENKLKDLFPKVGKLIEDGDIKSGINLIFDFISYSNKYFDEKQPWILVKDNKEECNNVLYNCCNIIYNINNLLKPYLPFTCEQVEKYLNIKNNKWEYNQIQNIEVSTSIEPLYERYDKNVIQEELLNLSKQ